MDQVTSDVRRIEAHLRRQVRLLAALAFCALLALGIGVQLGVGTIQASTQRVAEVREVWTLVDQLMFAYHRAEEEQRTYLLTSDERAATAYEAAVSKAMAALEDLRQRATADTQFATSLSLLEPALSARLIELQRGIRLVRAGDPAAAAELTAQQRGTTDFGQQIDMITAAVQMEQERLLEESLAQVDRFYRFFWIGLAALTLVLAIPLAWMARRSFAALRAEYAAVGQLMTLITERTSLLNERSNLLRELSHRVGNNLIVIGTILDLQALKSPEPHVRRMLADMKHRIIAVGEVHRRLGRTAPTGMLDLGEHLRDLCLELGSSLGLDDRLTVDADDVKASVEKATNLSLLVNELVTNAHKHSSGGGINRCTIHVSLKRRGGTLVLTVTDSGRGFPEGFDASQSTGIGMSIIQSLASNLGGTLSYSKAGEPGQVRVEIALTPDWLGREMVEADHPGTGQVA